MEGKSSHHLCSTPTTLFHLLYDGLIVIWKCPFQTRAAFLCMFCLPSVHKDQIWVNKFLLFLTYRRLLGCCSYQPHIKSVSGSCLACKFLSDQVAYGGQWNWTFKCEPKFFKKTKHLFLSPNWRLWLWCIKMHKKKKLKRQKTLLQRYFSRAFDTFQQQSFWICNFKVPHLGNGLQTRSEAWVNARRHC